jgi:flagellar L-ring protein precursor FlgH
MALERCIAAAGVAVLVAGFAPRAAAQQAAPDTAAIVLAAPDTARLARAPRRSWLADRRDFQVGDLITVLVDEYTLATANKATIASRDRSRRASLGVEDGTAGPGDRAVVDVGVQTRLAGESRERGQATRQDRLAAEVTVRVVEVGPGGLLRVEGSKTVVMDDHEQQVTLSGWVRPEDISPQNVIDSWRISDSRIEYRAAGDLGKPRSGLLSRILDLIWP